MSHNSFIDVSYQVTDYLIINMRKSGEHREHTMTLRGDETIYELHRKIALLSNSKTSVAETIYSYVKSGKHHIPLYFAYEDYKVKDPYQMTHQDPLFVKHDGTPKLGPPKTIHKYTSLEERLSMIRQTHKLDEPTIYYVDISDYLSDMKDVFDSGPDYVSHGILAIYWDIKDATTWLADKSRLKDLRKYQDKQDKQETMIQSLCEKTAKDTSSVRATSFHPELVIYKNQSNYIQTDVNLLAIFKDFVLSERIPSLRIYTDEFLDACSKVRTSSIQTDILTEEPSQCVSLSAFESWTKGIVLGTSSGFPEYLKMKNTLTFIVYDESFTYAIRCMLSLDGSVQVIFPKDKTHGVAMTDEFVSDYLTYINRHIIEWINGEKVYVPMNGLIAKMDMSPSRIQGSLLYMIREFKPQVLQTIFDNDYTEFVHVEGSQIAQGQLLHLNYQKSSDTRNPIYKYTYLTNLRRLKVEPKQMVNALGHRFSLSPSDAASCYDEWVRLTQSHGLPRITDDTGVSVVIQKVLDTISVTVLGVHNLQEMHRLLSSLTCMLSIYDDSLKKKNIPVKIQRWLKPPGKDKLSYISLTRDTEEESEDDSDTEESEESEEPELQRVASEDMGEPDDPDDPDEYEESDEEDSEEESEEEYERLGHAESKKVKSHRGGGNEDGTFDNKKYLSQLLEDADPGLFTFKTSDTDTTYPRKCQKAQMKQPLVLTRKELSNINTRLKQLDPSHVDIGFKEYSIDRRNPEIVYLCPEYWDRKHQLVFPKGAKQSPIPGEPPLESIIYDKKHTDSSRYVIHRGSNNNEIYFIHDTHPQKFALPCCRKKVVAYKKKQVVNAQIKSQGDYIWVPGVIQGPKKGDDTYPVEIDGETRDIHISSLATYKEESRGLVRACPLQENGKGHVSDILKSVFFMKHDNPLLTKPYQDGFLRVGVSQDADALLNALNYLISKQQKRTLPEFKKAILRDVAHMDVQSLLGGHFMTIFNDPTKELPDVSRVHRSKRDTVIQEAIETSSKERFTKYVEDTMYSKSTDVALWITLLAEIGIHPSNTLFGKVTRIQIIAFEDINDTCRIIQPYHGYPHKRDKDAVFLFLNKRESIIEPLLYKYNTTEHAFVTSVTDKDFQYGQPCVFGGSIGYIDTKKPQSSEHVTLEMLHTNDRHKVLCEELRAYDLSVLVSQVIELISLKEPIVSSPNAPLSHKDAMVLVKKLNEEYHTAYQCIKGRCYYRDCLNQVSHILLYDKHVPSKEKTLVTLPIQPFQPTHISDKYRSLQKMPQVLLENVMSFYHKVDTIIQNDPYFESYQPYIKDVSGTILTHKGKMTHYLFGNGTMIPLIVKPEGSYYKDKVQDYDPEHPDLKISLDNQSIGRVGQSYFTGSSGSEFSERTHRYNQNRSLYHMVSASISVIIRDTESLRSKVSEILDKPVTLPIRKRIRLYELLQHHKEIAKIQTLQEMSEDMRERSLKKYIEQLLIQGIQTEILQPLSIFEYRRPKDNESVYTQRDILNENHVYDFKGENPYKRNVILYGVPSEYPLRKRTLRDIHDKVSFYTKYPRGMKQYFGDFKIYTHIMADYSSDLATIAYALSDTGLTEEVLRGMCVEENVEWNPCTSETLMFMSETLRDAYSLDIGFAVYSNLYGKHPTDFNLKISVYDSLVADDLQMICLYQDVYSSDKVLKNIALQIDPETTDYHCITPLQHLMRQRKFPEVFKQQTHIL